MAFRNVYISSGCKLSLNKAQMIANTTEGLLSIPLEDISTIMIESSQVSMSSALLAAVAVYFRKLFGASFKRKDGSRTNSRLNYGYAIIRGLISRLIVSYGLDPTLGIHHHNDYNAFNLADDLIESFRPLVNLLVYGMNQEDDDFTSGDKQEIYNILNMYILIDKKRYALSYGIEKYIQSIQASIKNGKEEVVKCEITSLRQHEYE